MTTTELSAAPAEAPPITARRFFRRLFIITMTYAAVTVLAGMPTWFGLIPRGGELWQLTPYVLVTMVPASLLADYLAVRAFSRPVCDGLACLETGGECPPELLERALVRALNLPGLTALRVMLIHLPAGFIVGFVVFALMSSRLGILLSGRTLGFLLIMGTVISATHAILEHFAVQHEVQQIIPAIARRLTLSPRDMRARASTVGIQTQLLVVMAAITLIPLIISAVNVVYRLVTPLGGGTPAGSLAAEPLILPLAVVVIYALVFMSIIALLLARHMRSLLERVVQAMDRVRVGDLSPRLDIVTADEFADLYTGFNEMTVGLRERARLRDAFGRYVSPDLAERVNREGVVLTGQTVQASVMFVDIRDFTALSEHMEPHVVVALLNDYFERIEPVVKAEDGWINRFMGDGFMAVFGAPVICDDHAARAVRAARRIREATQTYNAECDWPDLRIGIGIDTGEMVAGSVGSPDRLEYTVIGNAANIASRIEALNKQFGTTILVSQAVYEQAGLEGAAHPMPPVRVKGVSEPMIVYEVE